MRHGHRPVGHIGGQQGGWRHQHHVCPKHAERTDVAACHATVFDVPHDREREPVETFDPECLAHGETVDQCLSRMLMPTIAGIDHRSVGPIADLPWRACGFVAHDKCIDPHVRDGLDGVAQTFAFVHARRRHAERHCVGRQPLGGSFKRQSCASGVFEEQTHHGFAAQGWHLGHWSGIDFNHVAGEFKQSHHAIMTEFIDAAQMLHDETRLVMTTPSCVARTSSSTCVGRFLPT